MLKNVNLNIILMDASKVVYEAMCYLRTIDLLNNVTCMLLTNKSYLSPKPEMSILRLELLAAVVVVKINQMLRKELRVELVPSIVWTDSSIALLSLKNEQKRFPFFVLRRISMITKNTCISKWSHVPTKLNPDNLLSPGSRADSLARVKS